MGEVFHDNRVCIPNLAKSPLIFQTLAYINQSIENQIDTNFTQEICQRLFDGVYQVLKRVHSQVNNFFKTPFVDRNFFHTFAIPKNGGFYALFVL